MNDPMEMPAPQLGLRRRRRAIPDQQAPDPPPPPPQQPPMAAAPPIARGDAVRGGGGGRRRWRGNPPSDMDGNNNNRQFHHYHQNHFKLSHLYCLLSTILAILAIIAAVPAPTRNNAASTATTASLKQNQNIPLAQLATAEQVMKAAAVGVAAKRGEINTEVADPKDLLQSIQQWWNMHPMSSNNINSKKISNEDADHNKNNQNSNNDKDTEESLNLRNQGSTPPGDGSSKQQHHHPHAWWLKWTTATSKPNSKGEDGPTTSEEEPTTNPTHQLLQLIDPAIRNPTTHTPTDIIEKVLTSTPRLLAIANFLLAMTYLLHSAVATWFLGQQNNNDSNHNNNNNRGGNNNRFNPQQQQQQQNGLVVDWSNSAGARERMGGFLVFKLLLISAVVAPDTLDLLILLTWYTMLSCLRSLDHLAHATTTHLAALGQPPRPGVLKLLLLVLTCNILAAATCVALFHAAGWGMVLLLTCDCALLAADVLSHILKHVQCVLDDQHSQTIQALEARQLDLHNNNSNNTNRRQGSFAEDGTDIVESDTVENENHNAEEEEEEQQGAEVRAMSAYEIQQESRRLDQKMEVLELAHARRLSILESTMFSLELLCHILTVAHFCHIWSLHGVQFTLIDGVLALHLHSAVSSACKKIAQRRNIHSIARDLQGLFPNASDQELRKASLAGDVCCICLGSMSTGGHVKKVRCGHLYHTHCLREVVERAQSIQAARCPLCRASVLDGRRPNEENEVQRAAPAAAQPNNNNNNAAAGDNALAAQAQNQPGAGERALFRFSTEGILPAWIPIPAFSFEVVRRPTQQQPPAAPTAAAAAPRPPQQLQEQRATILQEGGADGTNTTNAANTEGANNAQGDGWNPQTDNNDNNNNNAPVMGPEQQAQQQPASFLRRILVLAGAIPMSPEEEARALAQLVDMFPQYDRSDLLRELRERGSAESVAEAILMGIFSGVPRGD